MMNPLLAIGCTRSMVDKDRERGIILGSADKVRDILGVALASEQHGARQSAIDLIHILGAHGYAERCVSYFTGPRINRTRKQQRIWAEQRPVRDLTSIPGGGGEFLPHLREVARASRLSLTSLVFVLIDENSPTR